MKIKQCIAMVLGIVAMFSFASCGSCEGGESKIERTDKGTLGYIFTEYEGYYYEDASILEENNRVIISYTTNKTKNAEDSVIAIRTGVKTADGYSFTDKETIAVQPSQDGWDKYNIGASDLVAGEFSYNNTAYKYLMAYHANNVVTRKRLQVGFAVSNDLTNWTKVGNKPFISYDYEICGDTDGVCNPSLVNVNGEGNVLLFYSYASSRITETRFVEAKLSSLDAPVVSGSISVAHKGLPLDGLEWATVINADFGYDAAAGEIYLVKDGMVFASQNAKKATLVQLAKIPYADLYKQEATWTRIASIMGLEAGGYTRMHSAALATNENGHMQNDLSIVFTSSVAAQNVSDNSYIWKSGLHYYTVQAERGA